MTGHDRDVSPQAPPHAGTGLISGSSAAPGSASGSDRRRWMKQSNEPAFKGGSLLDIMGSSPPPSKILKCREPESEGGKKKRKYAVFDASGKGCLCSQCGKPFQSLKAVCGHMRVHTSRPKQQAEELAFMFLDLGQGKLKTKEGDGGAVAEGGASSSAAEAQRKKIHMELDLNKEAPNDN